MDREVVEFNGITFVRYPGSKSKSASRHFYPFADGKRMAGVGALHREIWKHHHGDIPFGWQIHHKDGDFSNNDISNLEAYPPSEHYRKQEQLYGATYKALRRAHADRIRPLAADWHRSPAGRAWHREHGKRTWENRKPVERVCVECGKQYESLVNRESDRFCSRACISRFNEHTKRYYEDRSCVVCGGAFTVKKSKKQQTCSRKCAWVLRRRNSSGVQPPD